MGCGGSASRNLLIRQPHDTGSDKPLAPAGSALTAVRHQLRQKELEGTLLKSVLPGEITEVDSHSQGHDEIGSPRKKPQRKCAAEVENMQAQKDVTAKQMMREASKQALVLCYRRAAGTTSYDVNGAAAGSQPEEVGTQQAPAALLVPRPPSGGSRQRPAPSGGRTLRTLAEAVPDSGIELTASCQEARCANVHIEDEKWNLLPSVGTWHLSWQTRLETSSRVSEARQIPRDVGFPDEAPGEVHDVQQVRCEAREFIQRPSAKLLERLEEDKSEMKDNVASISWLLLPSVGTWAGPGLFKEDHPLGC